MKSNVVKGMSGLLTAALASVCFGQKVDGVSMHRVGEGVEVVISGTGLGQPREVRANHDRTYILEFDASMAGNGRKVDVNAGGLDHVQIVWFRPKPPKVRVALYMDEGQSPKLHKTDGGWTVGLNVKDKAPANTPKKSADGFPTQVPPLDTPKKAPVVIDVLPVVASAPRVTLDFVNTDVVQILKALAMQAGVNIITSPDVTGKVTVSLSNVSVTQALDFVTTMVGLRYAKVYDTYVVTASSKFSDSLRQINGKQDVNSESRVVPIVSGQGAQIKATVVQSIPQERQDGKYSMILPSEDISLTTTNAAPPSSGADKDKGDSSDKAAKTQVETKTPTSTDGKGKRDSYVIIVGTASRLDEIESMIHRVDDQIARASNMGPNSSMETKVVPIYCSQVAKIKDSLQSMIDRDPKREAFRVNDSLTSTGGGDDSVSFLLISGPAGSLDSLETFARTLDKAICETTGVSIPTSQDDARRSYEVVDLKFVEPVMAASDLQSKIRGLKATVMPGPVDPLILSKRDPAMTGVVKQPAQGERVIGTTSTQASGGATSTSQTGGGADNGGAGAQQASGASTSQQQATGDSMIKALGTEPMKLLLQGTPAQIEEARKLIAMMDIAPKQVAIELRVMQLSRDEALQFGLDYSALSGGTVKSIHINQALGDDSTPGGVKTGLQFPGGGVFNVLGKLDQISTKNNLIARPNIIAADGRPTRIFVGDNVRYIQSIQSTQQGVTVTTGQIDVGVTFFVTPRVGSGGNIALDLRPQLSILTGFTDVPGGGKLPQTSQRDAQSLINVKSGETIAIGGLIQDQDSKVYGGIPILKDLPIIGRLFGRTNNDRSRSEVVFFVTCKEVNVDNRDGAANPKQAELDNKTWPGGGPNEKKVKGGKGGGRG